MGAVLVDEATKNTSELLVLLVVVVVFVAQVRDQLVQAISNSDPRVRMFLVHRLNSNFQSIFTL